MTPAAPPSPGRPSAGERVLQVGRLAWAAIGVLLVLGVLSLVVQRISLVGVAFVLGLFPAALLAPAAELLQRRRVPGALAALLVLLAFFGGDVAQGPGCRLLQPVHVDVDGQRSVGQPGLDGPEPLRRLVGEVRHLGGHPGGQQPDGEPDAAAAGVVWFGILGAFLAVPIAAAVARIVDLIRGRTPSAGPGSADGDGDGDGGGADGDPTDAGRAEARSPAGADA